MPEINYAELAAECERKAKAGVEPEMEWYKDKTWFHVASTLIRVAISQEDEDGTEWAIRRWNFGSGHMHRIPETPTINGKVSAQLFAEALLRDATKPLHREAYEAEQHVDDLCTALCHATDQRMSKPGYTVDAMIGQIDDVRQRAIDRATDSLTNELATTKGMLNTTHGQIAEMCEYLGLKREDVPCDAWTLRDAIIKIRDQRDTLQVENQRLRTALENLKTYPLELPTALSEVGVLARMKKCAEDMKWIASEALSPEASNG